MKNTYEPVSDLSGCFPTIEIYPERLTKLEAFTMAAMQGLCVYRASHEDVLANDAVKIAKATLQAIADSQGSE